jgi:S1-C subfamily serine protease
VTTYRAVRGAESLTLNLAGGRRVEDARVAAYDTRADLAILRVTPEPADSLPRAASVTDGQFAWALRYPDCRGAQVGRTQITRWRDRPAGLLELRDSLSGGEQGGPLIDRTGAVLGLGSTARTAVPADRIAPLLDQARRNAGAGQLLALGEVARRENHLYGSVAISSSVSGATARITPLEAWHWSELAWTGPLPHTFVGPMGRYQLEVTSQAQELVRRTQFTIRPAAADRLAVTPEVLAQQPPAPGAAAPRKGGFPMPLAIGGGAAVVGGLALLLLGGGGGGPPPPPPPTTGGITITFPNP